MLSARLIGFASNVANYQALGAPCPLDWAEGLRTSSAVYNLKAYCRTNAGAACCADPCGLMGEWSGGNNEYNYVTQLWAAFASNSSSGGGATKTKKEKKIGGASFSLDSLVDLLPRRLPSAVATPTAGHRHHAALLLLSAAPVFAIHRRSRRPPPPPLLSLSLLESRRPSDGVTSRGDAQVSETVTEATVCQPLQCHPLLLRLLWQR